MPAGPQRQTRPDAFSYPFSPCEMTRGYRPRAFDCGLRNSGSRTGRGGDCASLSGGSVPCRMDYTWPGDNFPAKESMKSMRRIGILIALLALLITCGIRAQQADRQGGAGSAGDKKGAALREGHAMSPAELFAARAQLVLGSGQPSKGAWVLLIADAKPGEVLFEQNADRYFVPASNMKLFTTALALAKLGSDFRFRTTLESLAPPTSDGKVKGPLFFVGRGDPNLSNRR